MHLHSPTSTNDRLAILEHMFPGWHIHARKGDAWAAVRVIAPTPEQMRAGLHHYVIQPTLEALTAILTQQLEIAQRMRG